nr:MAG TPA_asm: minor tail protein [Caudoviricetes sp.]
MSKIWDSLSKNEQMYYLNTQAGANQTQNLAALISNYDQVLYAHELALDSVGSAEQENARYMESLEAKISNFKAAFQELALTFINSDFVKQIIDLGTALLKFANTDLGQTIIKIAAFGMALKGLGAIVGKLGLIESFTKLGRAIKAAFTFTTIEQNFSNIYGVFGKANQSANTLYGTTTKVTKGFGALAKNAKVAIGSMSGLAKAGLAAAAIFAAIQLVEWWGDKPERDLEKAKSKLEKTEQTYEEITKEADNLAKKQEQLAKTGKELADSEKERLKYLQDQTKELEGQSRAERAKIADQTLSNVTVWGGASKTDYTTGADAVNLLIQKMKDLKRQYNDNKISQSEYIKGAEELNKKLVPVAKAYEAMIKAGDELTPTQRALYDAIIDVNGALVQAGGQSEIYDGALNSISANTKVAKSIVDKFGDSLKAEANQYYFTSVAAKNAAISNIKNAQAEANAVIKACEAEIRALIAKQNAFGASVEGKKQKQLSGGLGTPMTRLFDDAIKSRKGKIKKQKAAIADLNKELKAIQGIGVVGGDGGVSDPSSPSGGGSGSGGRGSASKAQKEENEKVKKQLEKLNDTYLESYQRRERIASSYYNKIQKKAWRAYKADQIKYSTYQEYMKTAAKNIFEEIDHRYDSGIYSADTYYKKITYFANKFYKKNQKFNKITYAEYRDYIKKATEETINALEEQYEKGKISGQKYYDKVVALAKDAKKKKILSTKEYKEYVEKAYEKLFDSITNQYERGKISAKKYYDEILIKGKKALKAGAINADEYADKLKDAAEAMKDMAQTKLDAFEFFAEDKKRELDKRIELEQSRIDKLNEQLEAMDKQNDMLDKQAERMELINNLADAKKQKVRIFDQRYGWVYVSNAQKVAEAQKALDEFDKERERDAAREKIEKEIASIEEVIKNYQKQQDAYDDLIAEQNRALERWEIENKLGMTIEQAVLQGRLDNFENFKNNYIAAINEMIAALERLNNAQDIAEGTVKTPQSAGYELGSKISDIASGIAGALNKAEKNKSAVDAYNKNILAKVEKLQQSGKDVYLSKGDDNKLHYSTKSASKANKLAGGANNAVKVSSKTPVQYTTSSGKTITTKPKSTGKGKSKGKASGAHSLPTDAMYRINELGDELLIPPTGNLAYLTKGTGVIPAHLTDNLMDLGRYNMSQWAKVIGNASAGNTTDSHDIIIQNMTVKSDNANDFVRQLQNLSILKK